MKDLLKLALVPTAICVVCAALLAYVYGVTKEPIAQGAEKRELAAAAALLSTDSAERVSSPDGAVTGFVVRAESGEVSGVAVQGFSPHGYGGNLRLLVAFDAGGKVTEYRVLELNETPGLGSKIDKPDMHERIRLAPQGAGWRVTKDGGQIEAVTAATISSRALMEALGDAEARRAALLSTL